MIDDALIETVARKMCTDAGLNPETTVGGGMLDDKTDAERARHVGEIHDVYIYMPQWRKFRRAAAVGIAVAQSVQPQINITINASGADPEASRKIADAVRAAVRDLPSSHLRH